MKYSTAQKEMIENAKKRKLPTTPKEYKKDLKRVDDFIDNIESYPPPKATKWGIDYGYKSPPLYVTNPRWSFFWGFVFGGLIAVAIGGTIVFNLLERLPLNILIY